MANNSYKFGYDRTVEIINTVLVNGLDEFMKVSVFIGTVVKLVQLPEDADAKTFFAGVVDACNKEWITEKAAEIAELEQEKLASDAAYDASIQAKKSA